MFTGENGAELACISI